MRVGDLAVLLSGHELYWYGSGNAVRTDVRGDDDYAAMANKPMLLLSSKMYGSQSVWVALNADQLVLVPERFVIKVNQ